MELLCLDAGNTVVFLDHTRLARIVGEHGFVTTAEALVRAEGVAKVALEERRELHVAWSRAHVVAVRGWAATVGTMLHAAGLALDRVPEMLDAVWPEHAARNLWSLVPEGLVGALAGARAAGVRVALVDPHGHLAGRHPDVPRVAGAREVATVLQEARSAPPR